MTGGTLGDEIRFVLAREFVRDLQCNIFKVCGTPSWGRADSQLSGAKVDWLVCPGP